MSVTVKKASKAKSPPVQKLLRTWLKFSAGNEFDDATWDPRAAQEHKLLEIVRRNEATAFGREHGFDRVKSIEDFSAAVTPNDYDTLSPYIERTLHAEKNVLTADDPVMFAMTSGTTGKAKYVPVTQSYLHEYSHGVHVHMYRMFADYPDLLQGTMLVPPSNDVEGHTEGGIPYGAISGYLARKQPKPIRRFYALPYELCKVKDVEAKYYLTLRHALAHDNRLILMPNPSSLMILAEKMTLYAEELIHDIRTGSVNSNYVPDSTPKTVAQGFSPDSKRADELEAILRREGRLLPVDAWANLRLISCWKGGTMPLYLRKLPEAYGDVPVRDLGYMASEGRGATPLVNSGAGGVLNLTSHFFEFIPEEDRDDPNAKFLTADELESNREYFIYFTTSAGLYRYDINDVVRVVDYYRQTPVIEFVRKGQGMTSITGEKLTESQVTSALVEVVDANGYDVQHFTACVQWGEPPFYAFYAELGDTMTADKSRHFARAVDQALSANNVEWEAKRESQRLGPPVLRKVAPGSYLALRQKRVGQGAAEAQVKIPQLSTDMEFGKNFDVVEEIGPE